MLSSESSNDETGGARPSSRQLNVEYVVPVDLYLSTVANVCVGAIRYLRNLGAKYIASGVCDRNRERAARIDQKGIFEREGRRSLGDEALFGERRSST